jgi:hypothetical protein
MDTGPLDTFALEHHGLITRCAAGERGMSRATCSGPSATDDWDSSILVSLD